MRRLRIALVVVILGLIGWGAWWAFRSSPMQEVNEALDRRDFDTAGNLLEKYLAAHPDDKEARLLAARTARRAGDFTRAAKHLSASPRQGLTPEARLENALLRTQQGYRVEGEQLFAEYIARPESPDAPFVMEAYLEGSLASLAPNPDNTIDPEATDRTSIDRLHSAADLWLRTRPGAADQVQGLVWRGRIFRYAREHAKSTAAVRDALARDPDHFQARFYLALYTGQDAPAESVAHFTLLYKRKPDDQRLRFYLATSHRTLGHAAESRRYLNEMLAANHNELSALVELGLLNLDEGKVAEAEPLLRRAHDLAPNITATNLAMSRCLQLSGKPEEAAKYRKRFDEIEAAQLRPNGAPQP